MTSYLIILGAGAILAAWAWRQFRREQKRRLILARLARYHTEEAGGRDAGYYPGSLSDPRD